MSKHTKGPWRLRRIDVEDSIRHVSDPYGDWISRDIEIESMSGVGVGEAHFWTANIALKRVNNEAEMLANARLIAAAPTMLEALKKLVATIKAERDVLHVTEPVFIAVLDAEARYRAGGRFGWEMKELL